MMSLDDTFSPDEPVISERERLLAVPERHGLCTHLFREAIDALHAEGGGRLVVSPGQYETGAIHLKSGIELHLTDGAEIRFSTDPQQYLPVVYQQRGGVRCYNYSPFIYACGAEDVAVSGEGVLDGCGAAWWPWKHRQPGMTRLMEMGRAQTPVEERVFGTVEDGVRPDFVQFIDCKRVLLSGVTFKDGPSWNVHPVWCDDVTVRGVSVIGHGHNNDGIDPDGCRNVLIEDCLLDTGDDSICLKSGRDAEGWQAGRPSENILVRRCTVKAGHGAIVLGSEMSGGIRNVLVHDITAIGTDRGIRIKTRRGRGGVIENVVIRNVRMERIKKEAIVINMQYGDGSLGEGEEGEGELDSTTPMIRDIEIRDIHCAGAAQSVRVVGLPENPVTGLRLINLDITAEQGATTTHAEVMQE